jgi:hypothetical protein
MPKQVRFRRGTTSQHSAFTGADGEVTVDTDKRCLVIHDGVTAGGKPVDGFIKANPGSLVTVQTIAGPLNLAGGDSETFGLWVTNQTVMNQVLINADAQIKRMLLLQEAIPYATNITLNFGTFGGKRITLAGNVTFAGTGYLFGAYMVVRIVCDGTLRTLGWPAGWKWVGSAAPVNIAASKTALLRLWSFGTNEAETVAQWLVEP